MPRADNWQHPPSFQTYSAGGGTRSRPKALNTMPGLNQIRPKPSAMCLPLSRQETNVSFSVEATLILCTPALCRTELALGQNQDIPCNICAVKIHMSDASRHTSDKGQRKGNVQSRESGVSPARVIRKIQSTSPSRRGLVGTPRRGLTAPTSRGQPQPVSQTAESNIHRVRRTRHAL